jgi:hypothetical protein
VVSVREGERWAGGVAGLTASLMVQLVNISLVVGVVVSRVNVL